MLILDSGHYLSKSTLRNIFVLRLKLHETALDFFFNKCVTGSVLQSELQSSLVHVYFLADKYFQLLLSIAQNSSQSVAATLSFTATEKYHQQVGRSALSKYKAGDKSSAFL